MRSSDLIRTAAAVVGTCALVAVLSTRASAQRYQPLEYPDFGVAEREWNGKRVRIHAYYINRLAPYGGSWDRAFWENAGITSKKGWMFTVLFHKQEEAGLFPIVEKKGRGPVTWKFLTKQEQRARVTLYGKIKMMGDGGNAGRYCGGCL